MKRVIGKDGVSMVEIMITAGLIAMLVVIAIPKYRQILPHLRLKAAARDIASALNHARMTAIARNAVFYVKFNDTANTYYFDNILNNTTAKPDWSGKVDIFFPTGGGSKYTQKPPLTQVVSLERWASFDSYGRFQPATSTDDYESIFLKSTDSSNKEEYRITISAVNGKVAIGSWNGVDTWVER